VKRIDFVPCQLESVVAIHIQRGKSRRAFDHRWNNQHHDAANCGCSRDCAQQKK
jgi:hypothetical protein